MGFFKDERVEIIENELVTVKNNVVDINEKAEYLENENRRLNNVALEVKNENLHLKNENIDIKHRLSTLEELFEFLRKEKSNQQQDELIDNKNDKEFVEEWLSVKNMCNLLGQSNETKLKYYLYEIGVYDLKINTDRNSFITNQEKLFSNAPDFIVGKYKIVDDKLILHKELEEYFKNHKIDMDASYNNYLRKTNTYKKSKKELESKVVVDYQNKINEICGNDRNGGYNKTRWANVYNEFRKSYPNLEKNYKSYIDEFGYQSKVWYVVTQLGLGNYLLRIACELYA